MKNFIKANYKGILHTIMILWFYFIVWIFVPSFLKDIPFHILLLIGCYFTTNFAIKYLEIDKDFEK